MDELQDGKEQRRCPVRLFTVCWRGVPHRHLSARLHPSFLVPICHRCVHEQLPIGSSFCSPTPALFITLAALSAVPIVQCTATTSRATFSSGHGKSSTKSATSSLTTKSSPPPCSLMRNQSRCAHHNRFVLLFTYAHRLVKSEAGTLKSDFTLRRFNVDISKGAHHDVFQCVQH
jgi:hypothetical protein